MIAHTLQPGITEVHRCAGRIEDHKQMIETVVLAGVVIELHYDQPRYLSLPSIEECQVLLNIPETVHPEET